MSLSIEHFAIAAQDTDALAGWYCEHLGFSVRDKNDRTPPQYFLAQGAGPVLIELIPASGAGPVERRADDPGHSHLAFFVDDFDGTHRRLVGAGVRFTAPPHRPTRRHEARLFPRRRGQPPPDRLQAEATLKKR